jgi:protein-disulfide isomerase
MNARHLVNLVALSLLLASGGCGNSSSANPTSPTPTPTTPLPSMSDMLSEKVLGSSAAPVTMIEYSSFTCSHCADFHVITLPQLKAAYIDTGRLKLVFRDFPLNEPAIVAGMVARCSGDRYFATLDALFKTQISWAYASDYTGGIKQVVAGVGMTSNDVDACVASADLRAGILAIRQDGSQTYGINATPSFIINGQKVVGALSFAEFSAIIQSF